MGAIMPWGKKEEKKPNTAVVVREEEPAGNEITVYRGNPLVGRSNNTGAIVQVRSKEMTIAGKKVKVDPYQLIRTVKRVTQNIGEYKDYKDVYSAVIVGALRKARSDLVSMLEDEFHIHWQINQDTGESVFFM